VLSAWVCGPVLAVFLRVDGAKVQRAILALWLP